MSLTPKEMLKKIEERMPYAEMCIDKKTGNIVLSIETLYTLIFTKEII